MALFQSNNVQDDDPDNNSNCVVLGNPSNWTKPKLPQLKETKTLCHTKDIIEMVPGSSLSLALNI